MVEYDERTALLIVDVQNDFAHPDGSLSVQGGREIVPAINTEVRRAAGAGALIVYTQDWHPASTPHFRKDGGIWPAHCVGGTWGSELLSELDVVHGERLRKGTEGEDGYSAFSVRDPETGQTAPTRLERILREHGVQRLVIAGIATDYCVVESVQDARRLGFDVAVLTDAIRAVDLQPGDGAAALQRMRHAGAELI